jgi:hypothetical protein
MRNMMQTNYFAKCTYVYKSLENKKIMQENHRCASWCTWNCKFIQRNKVLMKQGNTHNCNFAIVSIWLRSDIVSLCIFMSVDTYKAWYSFVLDPFLGLI